MLLKKSVIREEVVHHLVIAVSTELRIFCNLVVAAKHDQVSVSATAMRSVSVFCISA